MSTLKETIGTLILAKKAEAMTKANYKRFVKDIKHNKEKRQGLFRYATESGR